ncbi:MAG: hypothetical protein H6737_17120 [Alphaproteobacteria bacterium]|nr:hypothetical protein [Alphaproteobacteria bacterium]
MRWLGRGRRLALWYHPSFRLPFSGTAVGTGVDSRRADNVLTWLLDYRIVREADVYEPPEATWHDLRRVHGDEWLAGLDDPDTVARILGYDGPVSSSSIVEIWRRGVGAAIAASRWVSHEKGVAGTLMGGFHHAGPDFGGGFCGLSDIAVAIAVRRAEGLRGPIAIVDLDAHPPDGLVAFDLEDVEIRSVSGESEWKAGGPGDLRVPLGSSDAVYLKAVDAALKLSAEPVLAFYIAGSDPARGDRLGGLDVTPEGMRERDRRVFAALEGVPTVVVPGGGYAPKAWTLLAGSFAEAAGSSKAVRPDYDPVVRRVGRIARTLRPFEDDAVITEADLGQMFGRVGVESRFLKHYTRHGMELVLDRYGIYDALRRMGFGDLELEMETASMPHRIRLWGVWSGRREKLVDLTVAFRGVEDWKTLFIEWLEMKDPRTPLDSSRALPGQERGGLGLAREIASMLEVATRRLHLDGLSFVPSHYHVAWIGRTHACFADPVQRGRFRAMRKYFAGVPLHEASAAVGHGLPTEDGELIGWKPSIMVRALDPAFRDWLRAGEPEAKVAERSMLDRLLPLHVALGHPV